MKKSEKYIKGFYCIDIFEKKTKESWSSLVKQRQIIQLSVELDEKSNWFVDRV